MTQYFRDVAQWLRARTTKPIVASEIYWGRADIWGLVVDNFRSGGGNVFLLWHEADGVAGRLVDESNGSLTPLGRMFQSYRMSHP